MFLLCPHPDQYCRHWWCLASASQSWVCCSLLATDINSALLQAGCWLSHCCGVSWLFEWVWLKHLSKRSQIIYWKHLWWLPSMRKNLLDATKVLTGCRALVVPHSQMVKASLEASTVFIGNSSIRWLFQYQMNWLNEFKPIMEATKEVTTCSVH